MAPIIPSEHYLLRLNSLIEPTEILQKNGFIVRQLTEEELMMKRRCSGCNKALSQLFRKHPKPLESFPKEDTVHGPFESAAQLQPSSQVALRLPNGQVGTLAVGVEKKHTLFCKYHRGSLVAKHWTCCGQNATAEPCGGAYEHIPRAQGLYELSKQYQFHDTPVLQPTNHDTRVAVALDCEMGISASGDPELIRVTMVDYFSEEILVDNLIKPDVPMRHLNTRYSGVSWVDFKNARREGTCLSGKAEARGAIWRYVGPDTIVIGHGLSNDMRALRWIHSVVVDSLVMKSDPLKSKESEGDSIETLKQGSSQGENTLQVSGQKLFPADKQSGENSSTEGLDRSTQERLPVRRPGTHTLKILAKTYLNRDIQMGGKRGHDSLEDAVAARDLVHQVIVLSENNS